MKRLSPTRPPAPSGPAPETSRTGPPDGRVRVSSARSARWAVTLLAWLPVLFCLPWLSPGGATRHGEGDGPLGSGGPTAAVALLLNAGVLPLALLLTREGRARLRGWLPAGSPRDSAGPRAPAGPYAPLPTGSAPARPDGRRPARPAPRSRPRRGLTGELPPPGAAARRTAVAGALLALFPAAAHLLAAVGEPGWAGRGERLPEGARAVLLAVAVAGTLLLVLRPWSALPVRTPLAAVWLGAGAVACWGVFSLLAPVVGAGDPGPDASVHAADAVVGLLLIRGVAALARGPAE
ncbi:hypothetical protein [Streptomyces sp. NPDC020141]|uniref:hypothetical protein n=1 Tax=Streptomyces sp. NPDC020141 TaxID=3365065 RepID=UPI0037886E37